ncbi:hypothetical protein AUC31_06850 [Planococcus rifietoensis]|uniref:Uncharacterized protein n=1 Tax=Planococcus rifietoensis TaxID=200991 RepID=A0A0U2ZGC7_9BACL|nr:tetratricopeptide repeat protein [Planococcus rifietoensis]ALS74961.1 hypothetical protein AUC31_06850 [Planococcus rifietoensis]
MSYQVDQLLDRGVALKRSGNLEGARDCYIEALNADPTNMNVYLSLGKTAHLLRQQNLAIKCYLAFCHLMLSPIEKGIRQNNLPLHLKIQYEQLPLDALASLPKKSAFAIFMDTNTPRHLAHSLFDLSDQTLNSHPHLKPYSKIYDAHILGDGSHSRILQSFGLTASDQLATDEDIYIPAGQNFLLEEIQWSKIESTDVIDIYLKS